MNYANYRDCQNRITCGHIRIMIIIEITKIELTVDHIGIMLLLFIEIANLELTGCHIEIMLIIEITKIEFTGGHIGIMLIIEITKIELTSGQCSVILHQQHCCLRFLITTNHNIYLTVLLSLKFTFTQWGTFLGLFDCCL